MAIWQSVRDFGTLVAALSGLPGCPRGRAIQMISRLYVSAHSPLAAEFFEDSFYIGLIETRRSAGERGGGSA